MTEGDASRSTRPSARLAAWVPALVWMAAIFVLSSFPGLETGFDPSLDWALRKLAHSLVYALLMLLYASALRRTSTLAPRRLLAVSFCLAVLYAASDEAHQRFVPGRFGTWWDVGIDAFGAGAAWAVLAKRFKGERS